MIKIWIEKMHNNSWQCAGAECQHLPEYFDKVLRTYYIKEDSVVAWMQLDGPLKAYCRPCIDQVYQYIKSKMDSKLWAFQ